MSTKAKKTMPTPAPVTEVTLPKGKKATAVAVVATEEAVPKHSKTVVKYDNFITKVVKFLASKGAPQIPSEYFNSLPSTSMHSTATPKDPTKPRRANTPYNCFCNESHTHIRTVNATKTAGEEHEKSIGFKDLAAKWRVFGDSEKAPYVAMAAADKVRFTQEMAAWNLANPVVPKPKKEKAVKTTETAEPAPAAKKTKAVAAAPAADVAEKKVRAPRVKKEVAATA